MGKGLKQTKWGIKENVTKRTQTSCWLVSNVITSLIHLVHVVTQQSQQRMQVHCIGCQWIVFILLYWWNSYLSFFVYIPFTWVTLNWLKYATTDQTLNLIARSNGKTRTNTIQCTLMYILIWYLFNCSEVELHRLLLPPDTDPTT